MLDSCRSLFEKDKLLFAFGVAAGLQVDAGKMDPADLRFLLTGGVAVGDLPAPNPCPAWLSDKSWGEVCRASKLPDPIWQASRHSAPHRKLIACQYHKDLETAMDRRSLSASTAVATYCFSLMSCDPPYFCESGKLLVLCAGPVASASRAAYTWLPGAVSWQKALLLLLCQ